MRPALEVADIVRAHGDEFRQAHAASLSTQQRRVLRSIELCRTAALGGHLERCDQCGHERNAFNSCADRHCPKCQSLARAKWLEKRQAELLSCEYFHVVFTLPAPLATLALQNKRQMYDLLFRATAETLQSIAADPKRLGVQIGFFCILHTWGQTLTAHLINTSPLCDVGIGRLSIFRTSGPPASCITTAFIVLIIGVL
jgi:Transposase zinc-binding domain